MEVRHIIFIIVIIVLVLIIWYNREKWKSMYKVNGGETIGLLNYSAITTMMLKIDVYYNITSVDERPVVNYKETQTRRTTHKLRNTRTITTMKKATYYIIKTGALSETARLDRNSEFESHKRKIIRSFETTYASTSNNDITYSYDRSKEPKITKMYTTFEQISNNDYDYDVCYYAIEQSEIDLHQFQNANKGNMCIGNCGDDTLGNNLLNHIANPNHVFYDNNINVSNELYVFPETAQDECRLLYNRSSELTNKCFNTNLKYAKIEENENLRKKFMFDHRPKNFADTDYNNLKVLIANLNRIDLTNLITTMDERNQKIQEHITQALLNYPDIQQ